jgi:uncharacterized Zn finger protein (UPF0148 family)
MYCPKCGNPLEKIKGELTCVAGGMGLSQSLEQSFHDCYVSQVRKPNESTFKGRVGGKWFCPGCGVPLVEESGAIRCPTCKRSLNEFLRPLFDTHPHA